MSKSKGERLGWKDCSGMTNQQILDMMKQDFSKGLKEIINKEFNRIEFNKLCVEFLEWVKHEDDLYKGFYSIPQHLKISKIASFRKIEKMEFDSNWNWIMEVVEKIESLGYNFQINYDCSNVWEKSIFKCITDNSKSENLNKKEAVVQAIWEFLNWYNENNKLTIK